MEIQKEHEGSCHCGAIEFTVQLPDGLQDVHRCNCSMCSRRGAIVAAVPLAGLQLTKGEDTLSLYQFNTMEAKHYFCSVCGIYTHHQRRSRPDYYSINVACLKDFRVFDLGEVPVTDGINHPNDR